MAPAPSSEKRTGFQFDSTDAQRGPSHEVLLWRIVQCRPEVREGQLKVLKAPFLKEIRQSPEDFSDTNEKLVSNIRELLARTGRSRLNDSLARVAMDIASAYRRECIAMKEQHFSISFDFG